MHTMYTAAVTKEKGNLITSQTFHQGIITFNLVNIKTLLLQYKLGSIKTLLLQFGTALT